MAAVKPFGLVFFPAFDWAITPTHPEREERLLFTRDQIVEEGLLDIPGIREYKPRLAAVRDADRVHIGVPAISAHITDAHLVSAGGAITAAEAVLKGEVARAFGRLQDRPNLAAWVARFQARPAYRKALEAGGAYNLAGG